MKAEKSIEERFARFHANNPHVFEHLVNLAFQAKWAGVKRCGIELLYGKLRWTYAIETKRDGAFRLNDHFTALYARKIMTEHPDLDGFFETRKRKSNLNDKEKSCPSQSS